MIKLLAFICCLFSNAYAADLPVVPTTNGGGSIGLSTATWGKGYFNTLYGDGSNLTGIITVIPSTYATRIDALDVTTATLTGDVSALELSTAPLVRYATWDSGASSAAVAFGWGNHASAGYASQTSLDATNVSTGAINDSLQAVILSTAPLADYPNWNTAYGWGNHAVAGYASQANLTSTAAALSAHEALAGTAHGGVIPSSATGTYPHSISGNAATVTTNANLTGPVTSIGNATTIAGPVPVSTIDLSTVSAAIALKLSSPTANGQAGWVLTYDTGAEPVWQPAPSAAGLTFIFVSTDSDISGYKQMVSAANYVPSPRSTSTITNPSVGQYISSRCTNAGYPGLTSIPAGIWKVRKTMLASNANRFKVKFEAYIRNAGGTEHEFLENTSDTNYLATTESEYIMSGVGISTNIFITDRICFKLKVTASEGPGTITIYDDGLGTSQTNAHMEAPSVAASVANFVPYTGAVNNVALGAFSISAGSVTGTHYGDGSNLTGITGTGDNLGNHVATTTLDMSGENITDAAQIDADTVTIVNGLTYTSLDADSAGRLRILDNGTPAFFIGEDPTYENYFNFWPGGVDPDSSNYFFQAAGDASSLWINAAAGGYVGITDGNDNPITKVQNDRLGVNWAYNAAIPNTLSVDGDASFTGDIKADGGITASSITLGGVGRTTWPAGDAGLTSTQTFSGANTFTKDIKATGGITSSSFTNTGDASFSGTTSTATFSGWVDIGYEQMRNDCAGASECSVLCATGKKVIGCGCNTNDTAKWVSGMYFMPATDGYGTLGCMCKANAATTLVVQANCIRVK